MPFTLRFVFAPGGFIVVGWFLMLFLLQERAREAPEFRFAPVNEEAMTARALFDRLGTWAGVASALAVLSDIGPLHERFAQHHSLAPGMRTW